MDPVYRKLIMKRKLQLKIGKVPTKSLEESINIIETYTPAIPICRFITPTQNDIMRYLNISDEKKS